MAKTEKNEVKKMKQEKDPFIKMEEWKGEFIKMCNEKEGAVLAREFRKMMSDPVVKRIDKAELEILRAAGLNQVWRRGDLEGSKSLLSKEYGKCGISSWSLAQNACHNGTQEQLRWLFEEHSKENEEEIDLNQEEGYLFKTACRAGKMEVVKFLTLNDWQKIGQKKINLHEKGLNGVELRLVWQRGVLNSEDVKLKREILTFLLTSQELLQEIGHVSNWNAVREVMMEDLAMIGDVETLKWLLEDKRLTEIHGPMKNAFKSVRKCGLQTACRQGHLEMVKYLTKGGLKEYGHDWESDWERDCFWDECLITACVNGRDEIVEWWLKSQELNELGYQTTLDVMEMALKDCMIDGSESIVRRLFQGMIDRGLDLKNEGKEKMRDWILWSCKRKAWGLTKIWLEQWEGIEPVPVAIMQEVEIKIEIDQENRGGRNSEKKGQLSEWIKTMKERRVLEEVVGKTNQVGVQESKRL